jgi:hypothetical protein
MGTPRQNKAIEEYTENALKVAGIHAVGNITKDIVGIATRKMPTGTTTTKQDSKGNWSETTTRPNQKAGKPRNSWGEF